MKPDPSPARRLARRARSSRAPFLPALGCLLLFSLGVASCTAHAEIPVKEPAAPPSQERAEDSSATPPGASGEDSSASVEEDASRDRAEETAEDTAQERAEEPEEAPAEEPAEIVTAEAPADEPVAQPAAARDEVPLDLAIVQPGAPGSSEAAQGFLRELETYLAARSGLESVRASYDNEPQPAQQTIAKGFRARDGEGLAIVSLGFYLAERERLRLRPLLEAYPQERFTLVVAKDGGLEFEDLAGKVVAGGALNESARYLERVLFPPRPEDPAGSSPSAWTSKPSTRVSTALYQLGAGKVAAVVISGRERTSLEALGRLKSLEIIRESAYYPPALVVAVNAPRAESSPSAASEEPRREGQEPRREGQEPRREGQEKNAEDAAAGKEAASREEKSEPRSAEPRMPSDPRLRALVEALEQMEKSEDARRLLDTMACDGFRRLRGDWLEEVEKRYGDDDETK